MKKIIIPAVVTTILAGIIITTAITFKTTATIPPVVDTPPSPVDAEKITLTGTSEPGAQIVVTGGPYELSPTQADETGAWSKTITLIQESTNTYSIVAVGADGNASSAVTVEIIESAEQAAEYEATNGISHSSPSTPEVDEPTSPTDSDIITIRGTAEEDATIIITGSASAEAEVLADGTFAVEVELEQNAKNTFYVSASNEYGMMSESVKIVIEEISEETEELTEEEPEEELHESAEEDTTEIDIEFSDTNGHWAESYIINLAEKGIVSGYENGTFGPNNQITRAEITKMAMIAFEYEIDTSTNNFTDVEAGSWYENYVTSAYENGVVGGYTDGSFKPGNNVNRAEAIKILFNASGVEDMDGSSIFIGSENSWQNPFIDISSTDWFYEYIMKAYTGEIVSGYTETTFAPANNLTRAEACKIITKLLDLIDEIKATPTI